MRDLGGLPIERGRLTRFGQIVRADEIPRLTEAGWRAVREFGVGVAIDLRGPADEPASPPAELPIRVVRIPIDTRAVAGAYRWESMTEAYASLLDAYRAAFAGAIETVGRERDPIVIHCVGGRDRAGLAAALLLRLAGVDPETIAADHALSDDSWAPYHPAWFAAAPDEHERARRRRIAIPAGRTMVDVLAALEARHGGVYEYLREAGASEEGVAAARNRLVA